MRRLWQELSADDWRPDLRTIGLLVFVAFTILGVSGLVDAGQSLSIVFTGHPQGLSAAETAGLSLFPLKDRVLDGIAFFSLIVSLIVAIGGLAILSRYAWGATVVALGAVVIGLGRLSEFFLVPATLARVASGVLTIAGLLTLILLVATVPDSGRWRRVRSWLRGIYGLGHE